jgi:cell division protein FtsB
MGPSKNNKADGVEPTPHPGFSFRSYLSTSLVPSTASAPTFVPECAILLLNDKKLRRIQRGPKLGIAPKKTKLTAKLPELAGAAKDRVYLWRRRAATIATTTLALVMAYGVVFGHNGLTAYAHKREEAKALQQEMLQLQKENERLHEHVDHLQSDPDAIEHEAREELHYTRSGEVIYTLPSAAGDPSRPSSTASSSHQ